MRPSPWTLAFFALTALASPHAVARDYLVKVKSSNLVHGFNVAAFDNAVILDVSQTAALLKIQVNDSVTSSEAKTLAALRQRPEVAYVVENFTLHLSKARSPSKLSTTPDIQQQWSLQQIHAPTAWQHGLGSRRVTVAVIDSGVDYKHVDLRDNVVKGYNFIDNNDDPQDVTEYGGNPGHGTHCAGIIGGLGRSGGVVGMAPEVSIMPLRAFGSQGEGDPLNAVKAIDYAIAKHVDIVSASWGAEISAERARPLLEAVERLQAAGIIFVAAAGNGSADNDGTATYPANAPSPNVIAVAATDEDDQRPSWSNFGLTEVALAAPGANILSTLPKDQYGPLSGTSMAAPLVAGLVALLKAQSSDTPLSGAEARALLQQTGVPVHMDTQCHCRIDAGAAAEAFAKHQLILVPTAQTLVPDSSGRFTAIGGVPPYKFASANPEILAVAEDGSWSAKAFGEASVTVTDSRGTSASSLALRVDRMDSLR